MVALSNVRWPSKFKNITQMIYSVERHLTGRRTYTSRLRRLVRILALCAASPKTTTDGCDSLGNHGRVEAAADDSNDSLSSFFEDPTNPDEDSIDRNSSRDPDCCERVSETEVKDKRVGQSQGGSTTSSTAKHLRTLHRHRGRRRRLFFAGFQQGRGIWGWLRGWRAIALCPAIVLGETSKTQSLPQPSARRGYGDRDSKGYAPQEQPDAEETREDRDDIEDTSERQDYVDQLGDTSHLFEGPPRSQGLHKSQSMKDVEKPTTYNGTGEWGSIAPFIILSSFIQTKPRSKKGHSKKLRSRQ